MEILAYTFSSITSPSTTEAEALATNLKHSEPHRQGYHPSTPSPDSSPVSHRYCCEGNEDCLGDSMMSTAWSFIM
ncbi:MAG: hypothetical protein F6K09_09160 [Merismopedia sp. SIO2A8]|nr:hypothetical protein [Merismopedia sp. SIO2A8]